VSLHLLESEVQTTDFLKQNDRLKHLSSILSN
jgi:hypothetical protein